MLVSSQIRPVCPCSKEKRKKKGLSCKSGDRPYGVKEIHFAKIVRFAAEASLQQFTDGHGRAGSPAAVTSEISGFPLY